MTFNEMLTKSEIIKRLKASANPKNVAGMARFGINPTKTLGVNIPTLRKLSKEIGKNHSLAQQLWKTGVHEARILAGYIDDPALVTPVQMDRWVKDFDSWDVCDQVSCFLFDKTACAYKKAVQWSATREEFVKRAGFALMAGLAWHDKEAQDSKFLPFFSCIERQADDSRNFVKKAVNWALRQIGKRSPALRIKAIAVATRIQKRGTTSARWVANDALRELKNRPHMLQ